MITVKQVLDGKGHHVWTIAPDASVFEALKIMAEKGIGALLVTEKDDIVGIISERDYARKVVLHGKIAKDTPVREIMSNPLFGVHLYTSAEECMTLMTEKRIRHLPVCQEGKLVGVVSIGDIVKAIMAEQKVTINHLENYIMGKYQ